MKHFTEWTRPKERTVRIKQIKSVSYLNMSCLDGPQYVLASLSFDRVMSEGSPAPTSTLPPPPATPHQPQHLPPHPPTPSQCHAPPTVAQHERSLSSALWAPAFLCAKKHQKPAQVNCYRSLKKKKKKKNPSILLSFLPSFLPNFNPCSLLSSLPPYSFFWIVLYSFISSFTSVLLSICSPCTLV